MFNWEYVEFKETVSFPGRGPQGRAVLSSFKAFQEDGDWFVFVMKDGQAVRVHVSNVRYMGGIDVTEEVAPVKKVKAAK